MYRWASLIVLLATLTSGQTLVDRLYEMRVDTTTFDPYTGMTHVCVLVYPDGRYRLEKQFQGTMGSVDEKVYLDTLPEPSMKALQAVLDDKALQAIHTARPKGGIVQNMDTLTVTVPREHELQQMDFMNATDRKPYQKDLKPLQEWLKALQKRKVPVAKQERPSNCEAPMVMYRTTSPEQTESPK